MPISVTLPIAAPTGLQATLLAGGTLAANTTYYYVVIAYQSQYLNPYDQTTLGLFSPISAESSFTTDSTNKSVRINWNNVSGALRYQILLSTTSGDYKNSGGYGSGITVDSVGSISDGVAGYTITALSTNTQILHTCQLVNALPGNFSKNTGNIVVDFNTAGTVNIDQVYDAIVAAGFSDYVSYDNYNFILKGYFIATAAAIPGSLYIEKKRLVFIKGGVRNDGQNFTFSFGRWLDDNRKGSPYYACAIDILNARVPFYTIYEGKLRVYSCLVTGNHSFVQRLPETRTLGNFIGGGTHYLGYNVKEFKDNIYDIAFRGNHSEVYDGKLLSLNNFSNAKYVRMLIILYPLLPYSSTPEGFYQCTFAASQNLQRYSAGSWVLSGYNCKFYDCLFPAFASKMFDKDNYSFTNLVPPDLYTNQFDQIYYSLRATVLDERGNRLSGVTVSAVKKDLTPVTWIEHDNSVNRLVTGNQYSTDRTTDVNGIIDYYLRRHKLSHDPLNTQYPTSTMIIQEDDSQISSVVITDCTAIGSSDGQVQVNVESGVAPYEYSINGTDWQAGDTFTGLTAGTYTVYVRDANLLQASLTGVQVGEPEFEIMPVISAVNIGNCSTVELNDGYIEVIASTINGTLLYSLNLVDWQLSNIFSALSSGEYHIYVKDDRNNISELYGILINKPSYQYVHTLPINAIIIRTPIKSFVCTQKIYCVLKKRKSRALVNSNEFIAVVKHHKLKSI